MAANTNPGIAQLKKNKDAVVRYMPQISLYLLVVVPSLDCHVSFGVKKELIKEYEIISVQPFSQ